MTFVFYYPATPPSEDLIVSISGGWMLCKEHVMAEVIPHIAMQRTRTFSFNLSVLGVLADVTAL